VFVAKLCRVEELGRFALALAWATPVMLAARMQMRYVLASDTDGQLPLGLAVQARFLASLAALCGLSASAFWLASPLTAWAVTLAALSRAVEDMGELVLGVAQRGNRWPAIARSLGLHGLGGAAVFGAVLASERTLLAAMSATCVWQALVSGLHDWRILTNEEGLPAWSPWRRALQAVRGHAALGGAAALVSLNAYVPRYAVERFLGLEGLGVYTALAQLALIGNLAVQAVGQAAITPLGKAFREDPSAFASRVAGLLAFATLAGVVGLAVAQGWGGPILSLLYAPNYATYSATLVWLMAAAALMYGTAVLGYALVATGEHKAQLRIFAISTGVSLAASLLGSQQWGLQGAAAALVVSWAVAAAGTAIALRRRLRSCRRPTPSPKLSQWTPPDSARPDAAR
jgi:O-antigen/teichoic acid export membrane protein